MFYRRWSTVFPIRVSTKQTTASHLKPLNIKKNNDIYMTLEIQILDRDRHKLKFFNNVVSFTELEKIFINLFLYSLGMPFNQAISILKRQDRYIKGVQVWYSDQVGQNKRTSNKWNLY